MWSDPVTFYPGENSEGVKNYFLSLCEQYCLIATHEEICKQVFKNAPDYGLRISQAVVAWQPDYDLIKEKKLSEKPVSPLASKDAIINELIKIGFSENEKAKDKVSALEKLAKIQGYLEEKTKVEINDTKTVMLVKDHGTNDEWESKLAKQQEDLTNGKFRVN